MYKIRNWKSINCHSCFCNLLIFNFKGDKKTTFIFSSSLIILCCLFSVQGMAQATLPEELDSPRERSDRITQEMIQKVGLFPSQIEIIDSLNYIYAVEMQKKVLDADLSIWGQYRTGNKIMNRKDDELERLLTPEQFKKYGALKSEVMWEIVGRIF